MTPQARFKMTYDPGADVLGLWLPGSSRGALTHEIAPGIHADVTPDGRLTSVEVLDASARYPVDTLRSLCSPEDWMTLSEAARESGLKPATLRRQVLNGRLEARKHGRDWWVSAAALWTYLDNRAPSGRPPTTRKGRQVRRRAAPVRR